MDSARMPASAAVIELPGPRLPRDRGLVALGALMQLWGAAGAAVCGSIAVVAAALAHGSAALTPVFFLASVGVVRSVFHRAAGTSLLYGTGSEPLRGIATYVIVAAAQTIVVLVCLYQHAAFAGPAVAAIAAALLAWPAVLAIAFSRRRLRAHARAGVRNGEDLGFESLAVLMTVFGVAGMLGAALAIVALLAAVDVVLFSPFAAVLVAACLLLARSAAQLRAGVEGVTGTTFGASTRAVARYTRHASASAIAVAAMTALVVGCAVHLGAGVFAGVLTGALLIAWPNVLRRFYGERNFAVYLANECEDPTIERIPDGGAVTAGWLLLATGTLALAGGFVAVGVDARAALGASPWWIVAAAAVQMWAGAEMIAMSARARAAALAFAFAGAAIAVHVAAPLVSSLGTLGDGGAVVASLARIAWLAAELALVAAAALAARAPAPGPTARLIGGDRGRLRDRLGST